METIRQIAAVTFMNLRCVPQRLGSSSVIVIGSGVVVAVVVAILAMTAGMLESMQNKGRDDRIVVLGGGATSELGSHLSHSDVQVIMDSPEIRHDSADKPIASAELLRSVKGIRRDNAEANIILRGVGLQANEVRPQIKLVRGRMFTPGVREVIVGQGVSARFKDRDVGSRIPIASGTWIVVGVFESGGDSHESEILGDAETLISAYKSAGYYSSVTLTLKSAGQFAQFVDGLKSNPTVSVEASRERDYDAQQSVTIRRLFAVVAYVVGGIMGIGAIFGALNSMYSAVSTRKREIATLRALGFASLAIVVSVLAEALLLATVGGLAGASLAWLLFNKMSASTVSGTSGAQLVFHIAVTPRVVFEGLIWAACIGCIGGLLPAARAARLPVATALRA